MADLLRRVGLVPRGSNYRDIGERLEALGLDVSTLLGQGWSRGTRPNFTVRPLHEYLRAGTKVSSSWLGKRLIREGVLKRECNCCHLDRWLGGPIPLELDHINGDSRDNRLENLRLLCPNCHALTPTYRGRNIRGANLALTLPM
jgi:5-methylcytosine-specific restriction endonuclease McrA